MVAPSGEAPAFAVSPDRTVLEGSLQTFRERCRRSYDYDEVAYHFWRHHKPS